MLVASETRNPLPAPRAVLPRPVRGPQRAAGDEHCVAVIPTPWGACGAAWKNRENEALGGAAGHGAFAERPAGALLCRLILPGLPLPDLRAALMRDVGPCYEVMGDRFGNFHPEVVPEWFPELVRFLQSYYRDGLRDWSQPQFANSWAFWSVRLDWSRLTEFQRQVLRATAEIPRGQKLTYGQVAKRIGKPRAGRAVGAALGANPWPVLVPCHRVVGSGGRLTGFSAPGGVSAKARMLALEEGGSGGLFGAESQRG